jgi:hypothetical protein
MTEPFHPNYMTIKLATGGHGSGEGAGCFVEVAGLLHTGQWTGDKPDCFCSALAAFGRCVNDWLRDDERHVLWPYTLRMGGTNDGRSVERAFRFVDWAVREVTPVALEARGLVDAARLLRQATPVVDETTARDAAAAAAAANAAAYAATAATYAAATATDAAYAATDAAYAAANAAANGVATATSYAAYGAAAVGGNAAVAVGARLLVIDMCLAILDELCPPAPTADQCARLAWDALESLNTDKQEIA